MSRLIPNAQLAIIPDAGHFVLNDDPEKLLPVVATFLDQPLSTVRPCPCRSQVTSCRFLTNEGNTFLRPRKP